VDVAYNGNEAIRKIKSKVESKSQYSLIFMDLTMPIMNGYQTIKAIN